MRRHMCSVNAASHQQDGLVSVELAPSEESFCGWCDVAIASGTPRVARRYYHGPSERYRVEHMHASCTFHHDDNAWVCEGATKTCAGCARSLVSKQCVASLFSGPPPCARFVPSMGCKPVFYCYECVAGFVGAHRSLLDGYVGAEQMAAPVAWRHGGTPFALRRWQGDPPLPKKAEDRISFLNLFRSSSEELEQAALARHETLRLAIAEAERSNVRRQDTRRQARSPSVAAAGRFRRLTTDSPPVSAKRQRRGQ